VIEVWPSDLAALFAKAGMPRRAPPAAGDCGSDGTNSAAARPRITSPRSGVSYAIRTRDAGSEPLRLAATADGSVSRLYWFADDAFIAATAAGEAASWMPPAAGDYLLTVVDERGGSDSRPVRISLLP
jgi:penicillin-binding protein 1C